MSVTLFCRTIFGQITVLSSVIMKIMTCITYIDFAYSSQSMSPCFMTTRYDLGTRSHFFSCASIGIWTYAILLLSDMI